MFQSKIDFEKTVVLNKKAISAYNAMDKIMEAIDTMPVDSSKGSEVGNYILSILDIIVLIISFRLTTSD